nr:hypothetical protein BCU03_10760 [Vibrio breoganii]
MLVGYLLLFAIVGFFFIDELQKNNWSLFSIFIVYCLIQYAIVPISFLSLDNPSSIMPKSFHIENLYPVVDWYVFIVTVVFFAFFILSYKLSLAPKVDQVYTRLSPVITYAQPFAILLLCVSAFSLFYYMNAFGGFDGMVKASQMVRSGHADKLDLNNSLMTKRLIGLSFSSLALSAFIESKITKKIIFSFSLIIIIIYAFFISASKESIIELFLILYIFYCIKNKRSYLLIGFVLLVFFIASLVILDSIVNYISSGEFIFSNEGLIDILRLFSFSQTSLGIAIHADYSSLYFSDIITNLNSTIVPSATIPSLIESYSLITDFSTQRLNTSFYWGTYDAIVPPSVIAFGYYNLGVFGVVIVAICFGWGLAFFDRNFSLLINYDIRTALPYALFCLQAISLARVTIPKYTVYFTPNLVLIVIFLAIFVTSSKSTFYRIKW